MTAFIYKESDNCSTCLVKRQKVNLKEGKHVPKIPGFPGEVINIDFRFFIFIKNLGRSLGHGITFLSKQLQLETAIIIIITND